MLHRYCLFFGALALGSVLVAGCRSRPKEASKTQPAAAATPRDGSAEVSEEALARAHAHYAAGVVHDMNDETEAALQDYCIAATNDPDNEPLVLEVTRRLLQNKQPENAL